MTVNEVHYDELVQTETEVKILREAADLLADEYRPVICEDITAESGDFITEEEINDCIRILAFLSNNRTLRTRESYYE